MSSLFSIFSSSSSSPSLPTSASSSSRKTLLRTRVAAFCQSIASLGTERATANSIVDTFFVPATPIIHEHGPAWCTQRLPFIGHPYIARHACLTYFSILSSVLKLEPSGCKFPAPDLYAVDEEVRYDGSSAQELSGCVTLRLKARFRSVKTRQTWDEEVLWKITGFDDEGRFARWEIWADPLSAFYAVGGQLDALRSGEVKP